MAKQRRLTELTEPERFTEEMIKKYPPVPECAPIKQPAYSADGRNSKNKFTNPTLKDLMK